MDLSEEAVRARMEALAIWRSERRVASSRATLRWLSRLSWFRGRGDDAENYAQQAVEVLEPLGESRELAMAYSNVAQLAMLAAPRTSAPSSWGERAIALAKKLGAKRHSGSRAQQRRHRPVPAGHRAIRAGASSSRACRRRCAAVFRSTSPARIRTFHPDGDHASGLLPRRRSNLDAGIAYCDEHELDAWSLYMRAYRARARFEQASWHDALKDAEDLLGRPENSIPHRLAGSRGHRPRTNAAG